MFAKYGKTSRDSRRKFNGFDDASSVLDTRTHNSSVQAANCANLRESLVYRYGGTDLGSSFRHQSSDGETNVVEPYFCQSLDDSAEQFEAETPIWINT